MALKKIQCTFALSLICPVGFSSPGAQRSPGFAMRMGWSRSSLRFIQAKPERRFGSSRGELTLRKSFDCQ